MTRSSPRAFRTTLFLAGILCALAACRRAPQVPDDLDLFRREDPFFGKFIEPDEQFLWRLRTGDYRPDDYEGVLPIPREELPDLLSINARGMRGRAPSEKKAMLRVLCLGDSVTFGYRISYPEMLERALSEELREEVEVLNAGVPGYSVAQAHGWFEKNLASLQPDYVVALFGWNDVKDKLRGYSDQQLLRSRLRRWLSRRRVTFVAESNTLADPLDQASGCCRVRLNGFEKHFKEIAERLDEPARLVALTYPSALEYPPAADRYPEALREQRKARLAAYAERLRERASEGDFELVDLRAEILSGQGLSYFRDPWADPVHPSEEGAREIARAVARRLVELQKR